MRYRIFVFFRSVTTWLPAWLCLIALSGCLFFTEPLKPGIRALTWTGTDVGFSVQGLPICMWILPGRGPAVLIIGGIHGDEGSSAQLVYRLIDHLNQYPEKAGGRKVVAVPRANPDGLIADTRHNASQVDLNRNFLPALSAAGGGGGVERFSACEPETRVLVSVLELCNPSCVVSVHAPLNCIDPDGGGASVKLAEKMAAVSPLPIHDLPEYMGSMGSYVGSQLKRIMITYELDRKRVSADLRAEYFKAHIEALLTAIREG